MRTHILSSFVVERSARGELPAILTAMQPRS